MFLSKLKKMFPRKKFAGRGPAMDKVKFQLAFAKKILKQKDQDDKAFGDTYGDVICYNFLVNNGSENDAEMFLKEREFRVANETFTNNFDLWKEVFNIDHH